MKRSLPIVLLLTVLTSLAVFTPAAGARSTTADAGPSAQDRADVWVRLCGFDFRCAYNKKPFLPTPYKGNNVYNSGGFHQTATGLLDEGTDIRFWFMLQNDGDTATLHVRAAGAAEPAQPLEDPRGLIGTWKVPEWHARTDHRPAVRELDTGTHLAPTRSRHHVRAWNPIRA
jgi:hypothetical protein